VRWLESRGQNVGPNAKDSSGKYFNERNWEIYYKTNPLYPEYDPELHYYSGSKTPVDWCDDDDYVRRFGTDMENWKTCNNRVNLMLDQIHYKKTRRHTLHPDIRGGRWRYTTLAKSRHMRPRPK